MKDLIRRSIARRVAKLLGPTSHLPELFFVASLLSCVYGCGARDPESEQSAALDGPGKTKCEYEDAKIPPSVCRNEEPRPQSADDWFEDVTSRTGIHFAYQDGREAGFYQLLESVGGGVAAFDYDLDGDIDLFFTGGGYFEGPPIRVQGHPPALFRNEGDLQFVDVTREMALFDGSLYTHGCTVGDYNRDGWPDLFVAGYRGCKLYRNDRGKRFVNETAASGLVCDSWNVAGAWLDFDNDGWLDLYVVTYASWSPDHARKCVNDKELRDVCGPTKFDGSIDYLFRNRGDGTFADVSSEAGLEMRNRGLGVVAGDFDDDRWMDIYVVNDVQENLLYVGDGELPLDERGVLHGVSFSASGEREGSMGVDVGDFDGDGRADIFYTNYTSQDNSLMKKLPGNGFLNVSTVAGVIGSSRLWVGFGTGFADFNNDGWQDLFVLNGHVAYERADAPYFQPAQLFTNIKGRKILEISERGGPYFSVPHAGRGAAVCDLDNDGSLDLVAVHQNEPVVILRNRNPNPNWVCVKLRGKESNPDALGAKVLLRDGNRNMTRWRYGGGGYLSYFDPRILFPVRNDSPVAVTVRWPTGRREVFDDLAVGKTHELVESTGRAVPEQ